MKIPNRDDKQYTNIENFKEYELTYCIAYEMAIRNDEVIKSVKRFVIDFINDDRHLRTAILDTSKFKKCYDDAQILLNHFINPLNLYTEYHFFYELNKALKNAKELEKEEEAKGAFIFNFLKTITYKPNTNYYSKKEITEDDPFFYEYQRTPLYTSFVSHEEKKEEGIRTVHHNSITPNYSRPLCIDFKEIKERNIIFNLAVPTSELVDFIKRFKEEYDNNQAIVKNYNQFFNNFKEEKNITLPSIRKRYADMFFCYDCQKLGLKPFKIQAKIDKYYEDLDPQSTTISINTITKYSKLSVNYIDNKKYKQLLI